MRRKFILLSSLLVSVTMALSLAALKTRRFGFFDKMPSIRTDPYAHLAYGGVPVPERGDKYLKWLAPSIKIVTSTGYAGSGTVVYYSEPDNLAYVQSCGHLFSDNVLGDQTKILKGITVKARVWYHNETKLDKPAEYPLEVLYISNVHGEDCSLMRFKPDWVPAYFPIAPETFTYSTNMTLHSCGCDGSEEVAHYAVRYLGLTADKVADVVTTENSPRPGRSGGGLMSEDYFVGICWGTSNTDGSGNGYFTSLSTIRRLNESHGYGWLNDVGFNLAQSFPIIDRNGKQRAYPKDYIPLPEKR